MRLLWLRFACRHHACARQGCVTPSVSKATNIPDRVPFDTCEQCLVSASGRNLQCTANLFYGGPSDDPYASRNRGRPFPATHVPVSPNAYPRD